MKKNLYYNGSFIYLNKKKIIGVIKKIKKIKNILKF
jgi:hypothetical protein